MKCGRCPEGRRFNQTGIYCTWYGIIMSEKHECGLERGRQHDRDDNRGAGQREGTGIQEDGCGAA
jgi:hypothetical protein